MASIINATTTNGVAVQGDNSGSLQLQTNNGTTAVTIDTSQNVGIGVTSPTGKVAIDATNSNTPRIVFKNPSASGDGAISTFVSSTGTDVIVGSNAYINSSGNFARFDSAQAGSYVYANRTGLLLFGTNDTSGVATERMRVTSAGDVVMGHTAYDYSVNGFGFGAGNAYSYFTRTSGFALGVNRKTTTGDLMAWWYNQSGVGTVSTNGSSTSYNTTSDYRLKENITPMTGALATVSQLKPVTYRWKSTGKESQGFIAHELQAVVPDCVNGEKDAVDEEGNPVYQGVDTSFLVATLTAAIQELKAELDATKAEVQALKGVA